MYVLRFFEKRSFIIPNESPRLTVRLFCDNLYWRECFNRCLVYMYLFCMMTCPGSPFKVFSIISFQFATCLYVLIKCRKLRGIFLAQRSKQYIVILNIQWINKKVELKSIQCNLQCIFAQLEFQIFAHTLIFCCQEEDSSFWILSSIQVLSQFLGQFF